MGIDRSEGRATMPALRGVSAKRHSSLANIVASGETPY